MTLEHRFVPFEAKAVGESDARTFEGYGSVFDVVDAYNDVVAKGAFEQSLKDWKGKKKLPKLLLQHGGGWFSANADDLVPIGKWEEMYEDDHGLFMRGRLFTLDTDRATATYAALKEGELDGLSIGFRTRKSKLDDDTGIRTLTEIQLFEVSLVTFPANDPARVTAVKVDGTLPTENVNSKSGSSGRRGSLRTRRKPSSPEAIGRCGGRPHLRRPAMSSSWWR